MSQIYAIEPRNYCNKNKSPIRLQTIWSTKAVKIVDTRIDHFLEAHWQVVEQLYAPFVNLYKIHFFEGQTFQFPLSFFTYI